MERKHKSDADTYKKPSIWEIHSKERCGKKNNGKNWQVAPSGIQQKTKAFARLIQRTHFSDNVIITQRWAIGLYRLIVVERRSPESTIDVGRNWERAVEMFLANRLTDLCSLSIIRWSLFSQSDYVFLPRQALIRSILYYTFKRITLVSLWTLFLGP